MPSHSTTAQVDYYEVLRVSPSATQTEIRTAFKRQVLEAHPDKNPQRRAWSEQRIRELIEAFDIIGEEARREAFDRQRRVYRRVGRATRVERPFFFNRKDSESRALLVLHHLLHQRPEEALSVLREMECRGNGEFLADSLDRKDYLDCLFLLAEHHLGRRQYREAESRLRAFYLHDRKARFRRHYFDEVVRRLKDLYLRKLPRHLEPAEVLARLRGVDELGLNPAEARLRFRVEAEACLKCGLDDAARSVLENAREAFPGAKEVESIEAMIAAAGSP